MARTWSLARASKGKSFRQRNSNEPTNNGQRRRYRKWEAAPDGARAEYNAGTPRAVKRYRENQKAECSECKQRIKDKNMDAHILTKHNKVKA